ncbi:t-SNARE [Podospora didyma]|uniref:t-SNARE n=1 Tax=Podospora didyma TaxID=330526 RepID=A0AAE0K0U3_9PEZI|nr:t-SNARE [Podospora didyma]
MSYRYNGGSNPFDDREAVQDSGYGAPTTGRSPPVGFGASPRPGGAPRYNQSPATNYNQSPAMGRDAYYSGGNVEMRSMQQAPRSEDPNAFLNECRDIQGAIKNVKDRLRRLQMLQTALLNQTDTSSETSARQEVDRESASIMSDYRELTLRVRKVKSSPQARQPGLSRHVGLVDDSLKEAIHDYQAQEQGFSQKVQAGMRRQYLLVKPNASEDEIRAAVEDQSGDAKIFQQALMQGSRLGNANKTLNNVKERHAELKNIEKTLIELLSLMTQLNEMIQEQSVKVEVIAEQAEQASGDLVKANEELEVAVQTAKSTRKKKWICLGICLAIVAVIAIVVGVYIGIQKAANSSTSAPKKRGIYGLADDVVMNTARSVQFAGEPPVARVYAQSKIVVPKGQFDADAVPLARFAGSGPSTRKLINSKRFILPDVGKSGNGAPANQ